MKKLLILLALASSVYGHAQLVPNGNSGSSMTSYTNGAPNDPIYIWCGTTLGAQQGSLTATPTSGVGPFTFNWFYHDQGTSSWQSLSNESGVSTSAISNLASDGYRVEIRDASNAVTDCYVAWVWNLNTEVTASSSLSNCNNASLSSTVNTTGSFSYYNPPPPQSLINVNTQIQVCFDATHTFVSDLAFYLVGPPACGSPTILLSPNPGANGQGSVCNSGDNISGLCFTNSGGGNLDVCSSSTPLTGTYSSYGLTNSTIDWSSLIGCNAAAGGWAVQIYDCIGADVGSLTNAQITFSNLTSICGSPTSIGYGSGAINSAINDNSCTAASASIFQVPVSTVLTTPITIMANTTLFWTGPGVSNPTSANTSAGGLPPGVSTFTIVATTSYESTTCESLPASTSVNVIYPVVDAGSDQTICMGQSVILSGSGAQTYAWDNGVTNGVAFTPSSTATYTVTGTAANGCTDTDQVTVTVNQQPTVTAGSDQTICLGMPITLSGSGAQTYIWSSGVTNNVSFTPAGTQTYTVIGTDGNGCKDTSEVTITVVPAPVSSLSSDISSGIPVLTVEFYNNSTNATNYSFDYGNGQSFQTSNLSYHPIVNYNSAGVYTVVLTASNGICYDTSTVVITVFYNPLIVTVPNIFTPDGDGINDQFFIALENATSLDVTIVNRWGNKIASYSGINGFWDGRVNGNLADEGVYFYNYTATGLDGTTQTGQGNVELIRN
nr:gliding motility-associated C-terminal domain-containing protein [uncultured Fluviicola sp.]